MKTATAENQSEEERFVELMHTHRATLITYTLKLVNGDTGWAEDIVQETFTRAWRQIHRLTPDRGPVSRWLRRVAHNVAMDAHRMRQSRPEEVDLETADITPRKSTTPDHTDDVVMAITVNQLLDTVWPEHRAVLIEVYLHDRTAAQAAAVLGIPPGTVKSRLHYALRSLREVLDKKSSQAS